VIKRLLVISALFGVAVVMVLLNQPEIYITIAGFVFPITLSLLGIVVFLLMITIALGLMTC
jgi:hypothetical protein